MRTVIGLTQRAAGWRTSLANAAKSAAFSPCRRASVEPRKQGARSTQAGQSQAHTPQERSSHTHTHRNDDVSFKCWWFFIAVTTQYERSQRQQRNTFVFPAKQSCLNPGSLDRQRSTATMSKSKHQALFHKPPHNGCSNLPEREDWQINPSRLVEEGIKTSTPWSVFCKHCRTHSQTHTNTHTHIPIPSTYLDFLVWSHSNKVFKTQHGANKWWLQRWRTGV